MSLRVRASKLSAAKTGTRKQATGELEPCENTLIEGAAENILCRRNAVVLLLVWCEGKSFWRKYLVRSGKSIHSNSKPKIGS